MWLAVLATSAGFNSSLSGFIKPHLLLSPCLASAPLPLILSPPPSSISLSFFCTSLSPSLFLLLLLFSLGPGQAFVRRLLIREWSLTREVNHTQKSGDSVGARHVCMTERQEKDALWFLLVLSLPHSLPRLLLTHLKKCHVSESMGGRACVCLCVCTLISLFFYLDFS